MKFLPVVSLFLLSWSGTTFADQDGSAVTVKVFEGNDAILPCSLSTTENIEWKLFDWKKDARNEVFLYDAGLHYNNGRPGQDEQFKGRVSHFEDELEYGIASIKITKTKVSDGGNYTCVFPRLQPKRRFLIELVVEPILKDRSEENIPGAAREPYATILHQNENEARLQCVVRGASPKPQLQWKDSSGNIVPAEEPQVSERGGSYDIILKTRVTKTDNYSCVSTQEEIYHQTHYEISVYISGAAPKPSVTILDQTKDWALLQCVVRGASPKPKVEWKDSSGNIVPAEEPQVSKRGDSYDIILQANVTKTDRYSCVATQEEIYHQTHAEIYVHLNGPLEVVEGNDVILPCSLSTKENIELKAFTWNTDGQKQVFSYDAGIHSNNGRPGQVEQFKGRVSYFPGELKNGDASIKITNMTAADNGNYSCVFAHLQSETRHIQLVVRPLVEVKVVEGSDVILPCSLSPAENIESKLFEWKKDGDKEVFLNDAGLHYNNGRPGQNEQFKGRVSHFPDELKYGNASIKITKTKVADGGDYTCVFPLLQPERRFHIQLVVGSTGSFVAVSVLAVVVVVLVVIVAVFYNKLKKDSRKKGTST